MISLVPQIRGARGLSEYSAILQFCNTEIVRCPSPVPEHTLSTVKDSSSAPTRLSSLFGNIELLVAIFLGVVSIGIAYASFQAALYDSQMAGAYQEANNLSTQAESLYLENNQQLVQDTQVWNRLTELTVEAQSSDSATAASAQEKYEVLRFQAVGDEFGAAIAWSDEQNAADPEFYYSPLDNEDYLDYLFSAYGETKAESDAVVVKGNAYNTYSDRLTLNTVLMSIALFLLGISAVLRQRRVQIILISSGVGIFLVSVILTATIPYVSL
jgi:Tfp pilus assembly protein PilE